MVSRTVARRYARGLLDASVEADEADSGLISRQLTSLAEIVSDHVGLQLLIVNPAVHWESKAAIVDELGARLEFQPLLGRFLHLLAEKERLDYLQAIAEVYRHLVDEHRGVMTAEVTAPTALDSEAVSALQARLGEVTGHQIRLTARTDTNLLGGLVTRIGDVVYDGSLRGHLARIREELESA